MFLACDDPPKLGQPVVDPINRRRRVQFRRRIAQRIGRLHRHDTMALGGEIGGIASGPRADVEDGTQRAGQQM